MKKLKNILNRHSGRARGTVVVRHQGGGEKQFMRVIDFKRKKVRHEAQGLAECNVGAARAPQFPKSALAHPA